jgi:hypothetical protein
MINRPGWLLPLINPGLSVAAATLFLLAPASAQARQRQDVALRRVQHRHAAPRAIVSSHLVKKVRHNQKQRA